MNTKTIKSILKRKHNDWTKSIKDEEVQKLARKESFITGGAIVSLLEGEEPNDFDVYFKTFEAAKAVIKYYAKKWNDDDRHMKKCEVVINEAEKTVKVFVQSEGVASEERENAHKALDDAGSEKNIEVKEGEKADYRPVYLSPNAISLNGGMQLITRFHGTVEEVHKNFDFVHCTMSYEPAENELTLPAEALVSVMTKELKYRGSLYPLASILRTRKFYERGYHANAGQLLKMVFQLQELDLKDPKVLEDQLTGVDLNYMRMLIETLNGSAEANDGRLETDYMLQVVEEVFDMDGKING